MSRNIGAAVFTSLLLISVQPRSQTNPRLEARNIRIEFNHSLQSRIIAKLGGQETALGPFSTSEHITVAGTEVGDFTLTRQRAQRVRDAFGTGRRLVLTGTAASLIKTVTATVYGDFPRTVFLETRYENTGTSELPVSGWTSHDYQVGTIPGAGDPPFWSFQSGSYSDRRDWVQPLAVNFRQDNYLGMNATDYGGGTPVVDIWRRDAGIAVGHIELVPRLVSLPVSMPDATLSRLAVIFKTTQTLKPGAGLTTFRTFVTVHQGDYFQALSDYRRIMQKQGARFSAAPESAFGPIWCAWGYGKTCTPAQIYGALPIAKKLGFRWVQTDWGWESYEGDGTLNPTKFPNGDQDMKALVDRCHTDGFRTQLWWGPLIVHPDSELLRKHRDWLLLNADGSSQKISFWNGFYLCPANRDVVEHHRSLVVKILRDWGYDGLKLDGMHMNGAPPCYNPAHKHARPEEAVEAMPEFFRMIFETARSIKPDAVIEWCPCGTSYNFFTLPHMNMSVASDPRGSGQIRSKAKTLKALHGDDVAYFGDHVELSTGRDDFASTVGVGGVVGTNFTWPPGSAARDRQDLTPEKEKHFAKWIGIYKEKMLSRGEYLGTLYDIGFDRPEAHAIRKGEVMYYAFYAPDWKGSLELRGLGSRGYRVTDYENGRDLGTVRGPVAKLSVEFKRHLLLEVRPE